MAKSRSDLIPMNYENERCVLCSHCYDQTLTALMLVKFHQFYIQYKVSKELQKIVINTRDFNIAKF